MTMNVSDVVLVSHGKPEAKDVNSGDEVGEIRLHKLRDHNLVESDRSDEWVAQNQVLEVSSTNRRMQRKDDCQSKREASVASTAFDTLCGPERLDAMVAWMNRVDDDLVRLDKDIKNVIRHQAKQADQVRALERRKKEALEEKIALESGVVKELTRMKVAEETALARKRLQNAGVHQEEIDAILPVIPHTDER